jgi:hypothetical protein
MIDNVRGEGARHSCAVARLRDALTVESLKGSTVKKLIILALVALGGFAVWRRLQQDRAELDLWTEATSADS